MIRKVTFILSLLLSSSISLMAQKDSRATTLLQNMTSKIAHSSGITARYAATTYAKSGSVRGRNAGAIAVKGNKYFIQEGKSQIISNGSKVWNYDGGREVVVNDADNHSTAISPESLLNGSFYKNGYNYSLVSTSGSFNKIKFTPTDRRQSITNIYLAINKTTNLASSATITERSGNKTVINLSNVRINANLSDSHFVFSTKAHPNVSVVEN